MAKEGNRLNQRKTAVLSLCLPTQCSSVGDCGKIENYIPEAGFVHPEKTETGGRGGTDAESDSGLQNGDISSLEEM